MSDLTVKLKHSKGNAAFFLAFAIPVIILLVIYMVRDIYPFGDNCFLRSDMYHQYAPFLKEFYDKLKDGGSPLFSWNIGMGTNFFGLYAYYLASPLNWIIALVSPTHIIEIMSVFIILKTGLASLSASFYLSRHFHTRHVSIAAFSIFYALSSYMAAFNWNVMWLDCIVLLPLIILGLERLVKENKCILYCVTLALCIISNYYISIMVCIFSLLYFLITVFSADLERTAKYYAGRIAHFVFYSLIAGGLAAFLLIPVYYALQLTASSDSVFPAELSRYFSIFEMLSRGLMNVDPAIFSAHEPNIYSSVLVFLLFPLYLFNKKIKPREKVGKLVLISIFLLSFNLNIPNYIWHGFHFPNSLPCRESFIFIFLILTMSYEAFTGIRRYTSKQIYGCFAGVIILFLLFDQFMVDEDYPFTIVYLSIIFVSLYLLIIRLMRSNRFHNDFVLYLFFIVVICEVCINTNDTAIGTTSRTYYVNDNADIEEVLNTVEQEDSSFYRVEKMERRTKNDAAWHDYKGVSIFSSTANAGVTDFLGSLGFEQSMNAYAFYGNTPFTASLLSVKYVLSNNLIEDNSLTGLSTSSNNIYLYENKYTLPLGFMVDKNLEENLNTENSNPFEVQNSFVQEASGYTDMFTLLNVSNSGSFARISVSSTSHVYVYISSSTESINVDIDNSIGINVSSKTYSELKHQYIVDLGNVESGSVISITPQDDSSSLSLYAASFNEEIFKDAVKILGSNPLTISSYSDTSIKGSVTADADGLLFTSIPYDKGFSVYVDGVKTQTRSFKNAFVSVPVSQGTHTIEIKYSPQGLLAGSIISITCLILLAAAIIYNLIQKRLKH